MSDTLRCEWCEDTGVEPCDNCFESDEHTCHMDGVEYGPSPCRKGCALLYDIEEGLR